MTTSQKFATAWYATKTFSRRALRSLYKKRFDFARTLVSIAMIVGIFSIFYAISFGITFALAVITGWALFSIFMGTILTMIIGVPIIITGTKIWDTLDRAILTRKIESLLYEEHQPNVEYIEIITVTI